MRYHGSKDADDSDDRKKCWFGPKTSQMMITYVLLIGLIFTGSIQAWQSFERSTKIFQPTVDLGYGVYQGYLNRTSNLKIYKGVRYAAPPIGSLRWQKPQRPKTDRSNVHPAVEYSDQCPQTNHGPVPKGWFFFSDGMSEDCLFLNVMSPAYGKNLPVLVWFHGGGYGAGNNRYNFTELILSNSHTFVVVSVQYRLAAFGFMSSSELTKFGVANAGLHDQHFALEWIQKHITKFGGDPTRVTIAGESAGAGSVMQQVLAFGGTEGTKYFTNGIVSSPYLPSQHPFDGEEPTAAYNAFIKQVGCAEGRGNLSVFDCINTRDTYTLQNASAYVSVSARYGEWAFVPVIDGSFIQKQPVVQLLAGEVNGMRLLSGHNSDEAPAFVPQTIQDASDFDAYTRSIFPFENNDTLHSLSQLYSIEPTVPGPLFSTLGDSGPSALNQSSLAIGQQQRANNLYAEKTFVCPSYWLADAFVDHGKKSWKYQFSVPPAAHGADLNAYLDSNTMNFASGTLSSAFRLGVQLLWGKFITSGDPTLSLPIINNITNSTVGIPNNNIDHLTAALDTNWTTWQHNDMKMLNLNMTGGNETTVIFWKAPGITINVTKYSEPGLKANWSIVDARTWEDGRGRRCEYHARL
ncbi:hypothetical protein K3495_g12208 [Podosphaera aphanis]|nr:hypothetical protein K3495_g12208 [Podosphaera aphanis]